MILANAGHCFDDAGVAVSRDALSRIEELTTANRLKDEFLAMISHELRTPLGSIKNAIRLLKSQAGGPLARDRAQALIERQVHRMTQLVEDLLDVSRISRGSLRLSRARLDLRVVVGAAIETLESGIQDRKQHLEVLLPEWPVWVDADPLRLEQVLVNLLANASRYTDAGGELAVWLRTVGDQAVVRVRDCGIGIAADALPHIFDLFKQADDAAPYSKAGVGIGLALVRNLLELHGGSVVATSSGIGRGSEFTVCLPLTK